jgi:D-inositol-3-phosphate glycosyltransferase
VAGSVRFEPPCPQPELADWYRAATLVLVPSHSESFGLVALEAAACGTPVVAASVGGLRYVVEDGRTGFLVEGHDPAEHAERLLRVLRDPGLQATIGAEASRRALRFTWDVTAKEVRRVYDEVVHAA